MAKTKVAVSLDAKLVDRLNTLVSQARFPNRSQAIEVALEEKLERLSRVRLARECAKLDPREERGLAEEGMSEELASWPEY
jgi:metal-responsive CopG/Arc/MetJ family transcriptional regulator